MASKSTPKARSRKQPFKQDYSKAKTMGIIVQSRRDLGTNTARGAPCVVLIFLLDMAAQMTFKLTSNLKNICKSVVDSSAGTSSIAKFFQPKDYSVIRECFYGKCTSCCILKLAILNSEI